VFPYKNPALCKKWGICQAIHVSLKHCIQDGTLQPYFLWYHYHDFHFKSTVSMKISVYDWQEGADLLQKGEIGFHMYALFPMWFIGWPNLPMWGLVFASLIDAMTKYKTHQDVSEKKPRHNILRLFAVKWLYQSDQCN
jgi:hypothetical protein